MRSALAVTRQHGAGLEAGKHLALDENRGAPARHIDCAHDQVCLLRRLAQVGGVGIERVHISGKGFFKGAQSGNIDVQYQHACAEACGDTRSVRPDHARANHHDHTRQHARRACQQHAAPAHRTLQTPCADLYPHPPCNLAHRQQDWVCAVGGLNRLVGNADRATVDHRTGEFLARREVKEGEQHLMGAYQGVLAGQRLFHFHNHLRLTPDGCLVCEDRPCRFVLAVGDARAVACAAFNQHCMPVMRQNLHARRRHRHPILVGLNLLRNADNHRKEKCT